MSEMRLKTRVKGDTVKGIVFGFNIPIADLAIIFQIRDQYNHHLLYEAQSGSGIVPFDTQERALIEKFETDTFPVGDHLWEISVRHLTQDWDKVVYRGRLKILKNIIK